MTYDEAVEATKTMQHCEGMHITIRQATPGNEDTYYPDYVSNNPMHRMELQIHERRSMIEDFSTLRERAQQTTPPKGRGQKQHNLIQAMNKRKRSR